MWRKSNLNTSDDQESEARNYRRQRSRELHSIVEEDKRKNIIQQLGDRAATDKLSIYIRKPSEQVRDEALKPLARSSSSENRQSIFIKQDHSPTHPAEKHCIYIKEGNNSPSIISSIQSTSERDSVAEPSHRVYENASNKVEIDSDNVETPPSSRRILSNCKRLEAPRPLHPETLELAAQKNLINPIEQEILGDGQFDRFSSARRTRRFKRPTDYSSGTEDKSASMTSPDSPRENSSKSGSKQLSDCSFVSEKGDKLKQWQQKLKTLDAELEKESKKANTNEDEIKNRVGKVGRSVSRISQEDVREAIRGLKSSSNDAKWAGKEFARDSCRRAKNPAHELNDEGFEETQSLVSDTNSHGKESTSSCADVTDSKKPKRLLSTESVETSTSETSKKPSSSSKSATLQSLIVKNQQSLEKSRSLRGAPPSKLAQLNTKRATSMRKTDSQSSVGRRDVERSSSRTSLRSSRSSINSVVSTNTVKRVPLKPEPSNSSKKPFTSHSSSSNTNKIVSRQPASRSSSSGSSIGPKRNTAIKSSVSTSFKENQTSNTNNLSSKSVKPLGSRSSATTNNISAVNSNARTATTSRTSARPGSSFMRPTAASATKVKGK